jgi:hypothetical protein
MVIGIDVPLNPELISGQMAVAASHALDFPALGFARGRIVALKERFLLSPPPPRDAIAAIMGMVNHRVLAQSLAG